MDVKVCVKNLGWRTLLIISAWGGLSKSGNNEELRQAPLQVFQYVFNPFYRIIFMGTAGRKEVLKEPLCPKS